MTLTEVNFGDDAEPDPRPPEFTDEALALRFAEQHADDLRYVAAWSKWLRWDGTRWVFDDTLHAFDLARRVCREASSECNKQKTAAALASAKTVAAVVTLARADRRLAASVDQWDADPWLLNTPAGIVDLHTGNFRALCPDAHMTKITSITPRRRPIPTWLGFLDRVMNGDAELIAFMQRLAGYSLTGSTREHAMAFLYGTGSNGKTTFLNAVAGCMGDYHRAAPIETFTASKSDRHPTDLAGLRGARLVTATETEEGRGWAESRIKTLTGGDVVSARFMRQDFFEYVPQFKLAIAGNHKPSLRTGDEAIRRRFNLVPFTVTIAGDERDHELDAKLKDEWPGILHWMIEGCLEWQRIGLQPPEAVTKATAAYLEAQDAFSAWIDERCRRDDTGWTSTAELFGSWKAWAEKAGERPGDQKQFRERLEARGIHHKRQPGTGRAGYAGLEIIDWRECEGT
jgi:putative DNA primase/helicase